MFFNTTCAKLCFTNHDAVCGGVGLLADARKLPVHPESGLRKQELHTTHYVFQSWRWRQCVQLRLANTRPSGTITNMRNVGIKHRMSRIDRWLSSKGRRCSSSTSRPSEVTLDNTHGIWRLQLDLSPLMTTNHYRFNVLKEKFHGKLEIIGFPCNQFWLQEPSLNPVSQSRVQIVCKSTSNEICSQEIMNGIKYVRPGGGFVPNFPIAAKIEVNGHNEHPLYSFLKRSCPPNEINFADKKYLYWDEFHERDIRWNFEKFLIDPKTGELRNTLVAPASWRRALLFYLPFIIIYYAIGTPWRRYYAGVEPVDLVDDVDCLLNNKCN